jgi:hypothetical protein
MPAIFYFVSVLFAKRSFMQRAFLGTVVVILTIGFIGIVFILDWQTFFKPSVYSPSDTTLRFVVEVASLVAIILMETPKLRATIKKWISREDSGSEPAA